MQMQEGRWRRPTPPPPGASASAAFAAMTAALSASTPTSPTRFSTRRAWHPRLGRDRPRGEGGSGRLPGRAGAGILPPARARQSWLGAHVLVVEADGTTRKKPDGSPEIRTILFPVASATMYDVWDVIGLKGTGTDSYSVENLLVPERFAALRDDPRALREHGPLYKLSTPMVFSMGFAATSLGVARATLDAAIELSRSKQPQGLGAMRENNAVQGLIGRTEASLRAARAYLYATAAEVWRDLEPGESMSEARRIALRIAATWTIHQSAAVVDTAYHMAGATAVFAKNPFERRFRDMHAIAQQLQARDTHYEDAGRVILAAKLATPPTTR